MCQKLFASKIIVLRSEFGGTDAANMEASCFTQEYFSHKH